MRPVSEEGPHAGIRRRWSDRELPGRDVSDLCQPAWAGARPCAVSKEGISDRERFRLTGIPEDVTMVTQAVLAQQMIGRVVEAGVLFIGRPGTRPTA